MHVLVRRSAPEGLRPSTPRISLRGSLLLLTRRGNQFPPHLLPAYSAAQDVLNWMEGVRGGTKCPPSEPLTREGPTWRGRGAEPLRRGAPSQTTRIARASQ